MRLRLALIVPSVGNIGVGLSVGKYQAGAGHAQPVEISFGEIADIEP